MDIFAEFRNAPPGYVNLLIVGCDRIHMNDRVAAQFVFQLLLSLVYDIMKFKYIAVPGTSP